MDRTMNYYRKNVYGREVIYLITSNWSRAVMQLTGKKTATQSDLDALKVLGYTMTEVLAPRI